MFLIVLFKILNEIPLDWWDEVNWKIMNETLIWNIIFLQSNT